MFRPSRGHLQTDISNTVGSIQIMCGRDPSVNDLCTSQYVANISLQMTPRGSKHVAV